MVSGSNIKWYSSPFGQSTCPGSFPLYNGSNYYATQTINGCESSTRLTVTVTLNAAPGLSTTQTNVSCAGGNNGAINLTVTGGVGPFSYNWVNSTFICAGAGDCSSMMGAGAYCQFSQCHGVNQNLTNLIAGTYTVTVTGNGCTATTSVVITETPAPICQNGGTVNQNCGCDCLTGFTGVNCENAVCIPPAVTRV